MWKLVTLIFILPFPGKGQDCVLDDVQSTPGICTPFRQCPFATEYLLAGVRPKVCSGRNVCCPIEPTVAEKQCEEWRSHLLTPLSFAQEPPSDPFCITLESQGFIVGGRNARKYEYPHAAALGYETPTGIKYHCGGTIISENWILTAAHCLSTKIGKPTVVLVGDLTLDRPTSYFRQILGISKEVIHPNYNPPLKYHDIALIKLNKSLTVDRYLLPACLPIAGTRNKKTVEAIGWGLLGSGESQSNYLQTVNLTVFRQSECKSHWNDAAEKPFRFPQGIIRKQLCAGDKTNSGKDTCNGDSGGPLTINELYNGKELKCLFRVVGITSFGSRFCGFGDSAVYTRVLSYVPWIERIAFQS